MEGAAHCCNFRLDVAAARTCNDTVVGGWRGALPAVAPSHRDLTYCLYRVCRGVLPGLAVPHRSAVLSNPMRDVVSTSRMRVEVWTATRVHLPRSRVVLVTAPLAADWHTHTCYICVCALPTVSCRTRLLAVLQWEAVCT